MDGAKRKLLETTLQSRFDLQRFILLTKELLKNPKIKSNPMFTDKVKAQFRESVKQFTDFGRYQDSEEKELLLVAVELKANKSVARSRAMQRNFVKDLIQREGANAALVAFYEENSYDWRISFVKIDYGFVIDTYEYKEDITPARRYSFLVGENEKSHTAMRQLAIIMVDDTTSPTVAQIEEIFNIEKVTDEFFKVYREKYLDLKECLEGQEKFHSMAQKLNFTSEEFAKKLMGQLSFLYFLQRKGWLGVTANPRYIPAAATEQLLANKPANLRDLFRKVYALDKDHYVRSAAALMDLNDQQIMMLNFIFTNTHYEGKWGTGEKNFIRRIFSNAVKNGKNFYKEYLEPLFYNALNEERGGNTYYRPFNCMIPFLNGGLFQPIVEEYDMDQVAFEIPNELFSNDNLTKEGDKGDGILDIFDRYAFTVKEDEPLEKEVAVDPEMLGKVFENLLEVKDRKSKGAFYTPREIVHYMCQESLINYLVTETGISYEDINKLIRYGDIIADVDNSKAAAQSGNFMLPESIRKNAKKVDDALDDIRIADPAVGSGAFPLGMINEIVRARMNLTLYLLPDEYVFNRDYAIPEQRKPYNLKLRTIQHSIHAVDIERSAVEITKLRLWLSLVVDEENFSEIRPLPNLEYNIMCGNSLLEEFEGIKLINEALLEQYAEIAATKEHDIEQMDIFTPQSQNILDEIYALQEKVFATSDTKQKMDLKKQIDKYEWDLIEKSLIENGKSQELPKIRELKRLNSKPYFLWKLNFTKVFRDKGGFDVVIGNPPYLGEAGNKEIFREISNSQFGQRFYQRKMDFFYFFFHKAIDLSKEKAIISLITTNYFPTAFGASILRKDLKERTSILKIINFNELRIFQSALGQHNMITVLQRIPSQNNIVEVAVTQRNGFADHEVLQKILNWHDQETTYSKNPQKDIFEGSENYIRLFSNTESGKIIETVLKRIIKLGVPLGELCNVNQGILTGIDKITQKHAKANLVDDNMVGCGVYVLDKEQLSHLGLLPHEEEIIYPLFKNSDISQYYCELKPSKYLVYATRDLIIEDYPNIFSHFKKFENAIKARSMDRGEIQAALKLGKWWVIFGARNRDIFIGEKIVCPQRSYLNTFAYNNTAWFANTDVYFITAKNNCSVDLKYVLALLNSKLYYLWFYEKGKRKGDMLELLYKPLTEVPIKKVESSVQIQISLLVDKVMSLVNNGNYLGDYKIKQEVQQLKTKIDQIIYSIYGLTSEEIKIVNSFNAEE
jgi:adenine-specific DNA-methyltransferase